MEKVMQFFSHLYECNNSNILKLSGDVTTSNDILQKYVELEQ